MTKTEFLENLKKELKNNNVINENDISEILYQFEEHFDCKAEEGKTEEEIAAKLGSPKAIAKEYAISSSEKESSDKWLKIFGISFVSVPAGLVFALIWSSVLLLGCLAIGSFGLGFCLITTINMGGIIPSIPYFPAFLIGISCIALCSLTSIGTIYTFLYVRQWTRVYLRWCKNIIYGNKYPSLSLHPKLSKKLASIYKLIAMASLIVFISTFALGYFSMCIVAKSMEPWHIWKWFE